MFCHICGNELAADAIFCNRCGRRVGMSATLPGTQPATQTTGGMSLPPGGAPPAYSGARISTGDGK
jgi:hypothetical protein